MSQFFAKVALLALVVCGVWANTFSQGVTDSVGTSIINFNEDSSWTSVIPTSTSFTSVLLAAVTSGLPNYGSTFTLSNAPNSQLLGASPNNDENNSSDAASLAISCLVSLVLPLLALLL